MTSNQTVAHAAACYEAQCSACEDEQEAHADEITRRTNLLMKPGAAWDTRKPENFAEAVGNMPLESIQKALDCAYKSARVPGGIPESGFARAWFALMTGVVVYCCDAAEEQARREFFAHLKAMNEGAYP